MNCSGDIVQAINITKVFYKEHFCSDLSIEPECSGTCLDLYASSDICTNYVYDLFEAEIQYVARQTLNLVFKNLTNTNNARRDFTTEQNIALVFDKTNIVGCVPINIPVILTLEDETRTVWIHWVTYALPICIVCIVILYFAWRRFKARIIKRDLEMREYTTEMNELRNKRYN